MLEVGPFIRLLFEELQKDLGAAPETRCEFPHLYLIHSQANAFDSYFDLITESKTTSTLEEFRSPATVSSRVRDECEASRKVQVRNTRSSRSRYMDWAES